jgi:hypothetical protein
MSGYMRREETEAEIQAANYNDRLAQERASAELLRRLQAERRPQREDSSRRSASGQRDAIA